MFANRQSRPERRGIVLVLVLAMLGLLALIGVTFATFAGQSRINNRNYQQSLLAPQGDELLDFSLQQLISDTNDVRSAIRGHSLLRDMYGTGSTSNGYLPLDPETGNPFYITSITPPATGSSLYTLTIGSVVTNPATNTATMTNIASNDTTFYGYNFQRWIMRVTYLGAVTSGTGTVNQTIEIITDSGFNATSNTARTFGVYLSSTDSGGSSIPNGEATALNVPTAAPGYTTGFSTLLPGAYLLSAISNNTNTSLGTSFKFQLDGRWLHAFNGPGMGATTAVTGVSNAVYGNMRYLSPLNPTTTGIPFGPNSVGMDEDYDACDLENWFLAIQSADGQVMIPSFHRPAVVRYDPNNSTAAAQVNDWQNVNPLSSTNASAAFYDSAARILRPRNYDGHDAGTFPDLIPSPSTGQIPYDVDNDGDGVTDSVWLDLGYPARADSTGRLYKPLFAFMVIGLNGRIPLNTAGNLAGNATGATVAYDAGNNPIMIGGGGEHASHLGNSSSEVDPTYALQNAYDATTADPTAAFAPPEFGIVANNNTYLPSNSQVDNTGIDVRLTQLRNILAGTRPQANSSSYDSTGLVNGDNNYVYYSTGASSEAMRLYMPNGIVDANVPPQNGVNASLDVAFTDPNNQSLYILRNTQPVAGRWGEAQAIPGLPFPDPLASITPAPTPTPPALVGVVGLNWSSGNTSFKSPDGTKTYLRIPNGNNVRAGYSMDIGDIVNGLPRDAADDNFNSFDPWPPNHTGELGDLDMYDAAGGLLLPVERMRRWLTPADINGTGSITTWNFSNRTTHRGPDGFGRVEYSSYFRPPGSPGAISVNYTATGGVAATTNGTTLGAIVFPSGTSGNASDPFYSSSPSNQYPAAPTATMAAPFTPYAENPTYVPDLTNNPLHGFESFRFPNQTYSSATFTPQQLGGTPLGGTTFPANANYDPSNYTPTSYPTYDSSVNAGVHSDGLNEADEMNLYNPNPLLDSPFGPGDLEWLYRQQDVDGASLSSRLQNLAPISFTNGLDSQRRRRLFSLDSFETNNFVWTNDNPGNAFPTNHRFTQTQSAGFPTLGSLVATPTLAQRDKKINLNYPLPVSNDPNEPIRQKWINDTYQLLKAILPPKAVDTPEELAQLSQYVINIIDFRDPDCTMTHWVNPDVMFTGISPTGTLPTTAPTLVSLVTPLPTNAAYLDQYGMEYNPVAINEVLAYSYLYYNNGANSRANRFFAELINTLTSPELSTQTPTQTPALTLPIGGNPAATPTPTVGYYNTALDLGGYQYLMSDPYSGGCWDVVFTADDPYSRPDPYRGQLLPYGKTYGLTPLSRDSFSGNLTSGAPATDVQLLPLGAGSTSNPSIPSPTAATGTALATNYFYAFGNADPVPNAYFDQNGPAPNLNWTAKAAPTTGQAAATTWATNGLTPPTLIQTLKTTFDPINGPNATTVPTTSPVTLYQGVLPAWAGPAASTTTPNPSTTTLPANYAVTLPSATLYSTAAGNQAPVYYWMCLRRPANPFAPVSATNPMIVVDSVRFPFIEGTGTLTQQGPQGGPPNVPQMTPGTPPPTTTSNAVYSVQRYQPYRGGHAVPAPATALNPAPIDVRYGYSEQIVVPSTTPQTLLPLPAAAGGSGVAGTAGIYYYTTSTSNGTTTVTYYYATNPIYHTLGWANEFEQGSSNLWAEDWDLFPFNDRDFTSVAELMLVPGCSPGLFTKQFVEFAPSYANITNIFATVLPQIVPPVTKPPSTATAPLGSTTSPYSNVQAYMTGSTPLSVPTGYPVTGTTPAPPIQPHTFPYLVDKFFYSAYGQSNTLDTGAQVGGYAADGWFKMFEFFEVPSQMIGAIGPVASGVNFDWARQDSKPGLLNLNLIIDEEVFFSVAGQQTVNLQNGQYVVPPTPATPPTLNSQIPSDQFTQRLLNFAQVTLPIAANSLTNYVNPLIGPGNYTASGNTLPLAAGSPPVPMVVTSTQAGGGPASAYPMFSTQSNYSAANLDNDPINNYFAAQVPLPTQYTANLKAAWVQFLTARHGGSGYIFGYGTGAVGQNVAIATSSTLPGYNGVAGGPLPAERPFHSLSYPDIDYTIMRPAALPPGVTISTDGTTATYYTTPNAYPLPSTYQYSSSAALYGNSAPAAGNNTAWKNPSTYSDATVPLWNTFVGDPGVRNYFLYTGYPSGFYPGTPMPPPTGATAQPAGTVWPVYPPPIPLRRLFQVPDAYSNAANASPGVLPTIETPPTAPTIVQATPSNASETGDPTINMVSVYPNAVGGPGVPTPAPGALPPIQYTGKNATFAGVVTNSVVNLYWPLSYVTTPTANTAAAATLYPISPTGTAVAVGLPGAGAGPDYGFGGSSTSPDNRQHPLWRIEQMQRMMNLTTTRTHQYAVWITVGFFQVKRQGDLGMFATNPLLAFDIMGPEVGAANGKTTRYRGFYLVDRLQLTGFNPAASAGFRAAVIYRNRIQ